MQFSLLDTAIDEKVAHENANWLFRGQEIPAPSEVVRAHDLSVDSKAVVVGVLVLHIGPLRPFEKHLPVHVLSLAVELLPIVIGFLVEGLVYLCKQKR